MIRLSANLSKKVPLPGIDYSSQQYGASLEIEVSDADKPAEIHARIKELYGLLSSAIDEQIGVPASVKTLPPPAPAPQAPVSQPVQPQRNGFATGRNRIVAQTNGNGRRGVNATEAQAKCIYAICKSQGLDLASVLADFNVADARDLNVCDASQLIDRLKAQNGNGQVAQ